MYLNNPFFRANILQKKPKSIFPEISHLLLQMAIKDYYTIDKVDIDR